MLNVIFEILIHCFYFPAAWFDSILSGIGLDHLLLGMLTLVLVVRFLVTPLTGVGSDKVTKRKNGGSNG